MSSHSLENHQFSNIHMYICHQHLELGVPDFLEAAVYLSLVHTAEVF